MGLSENKYNTSTLWISLTRRGTVAYANSLLNAMPVRQVEAWMSNEAADSLLEKPGHWPGDLKNINTFSNWLRFLIQSIIYLPKLLFDIIRKKRASKNLRIIIPVYHIWNIPILIIAVLTNIPVWVIIHDARVHPGDHAPGYRFYLFISRYLADRICLVSEAVKDELKIKDQRKVKVSLHPAFSMPAQKVIRSSSALKLLFFGRFARYKGIEFLLKLLEQLTPETWEYCSLVGSGNLPKIPEKIKTKVRVKNSWIPDAALPQILQEHDIMLLPYQEASQSGAAALAQGIGLPVIASTEGALPQQLIGQGGIVIEREIKSWKLIIEALNTRREKLIELQDEAGDFAKNHSWEDHARVFFPELF